MPHKRVVTDAREFARHAHAIAAAFGVEIIEHDDQLQIAGANPILGVVVCARIVGETSYAVAMHEMGHHLAPLGFLPLEQIRAESVRAKLGLVVVTEEAAWEWAEHYAIDWTVAMQQVK